jgi:hypothetical protein
MTTRPLRLVSAPSIFPAPGVAAGLQRALAAATPRRAPAIRAGTRRTAYPKIDSGMKAETIQFGASTISLIRRSAATLATT